MKTSQALHEQAVKCAKQYLSSEKELLSVLIEMNQKRAFQELGYTGIFSYCLGALGFSESQANYFSSVAKKSLEVPALKEAIDNGTLSISKARRIVSVITPATQESWIEKAASLPQRELEREVASVNPRAIQERVRPVDFDRHEIRFALSQNAKAKLDRAILLLSRNKGKRTTMEETIEALLDSYLERKDPIKKAERTFLRKVTPEKITQGRRMPTQVRHHVNLRDQGKCQAPGCENRIWTEIHHKIPVAHGGLNTTGNLITLCTAHHRMIHAKLCLA